jgi:hypothetical protein
MAYTLLSIDAPTLLGYDSENPTQATEELNLQLHNVLQDMEDAGVWYMSDECPPTAHADTAGSYIVANYKITFLYAKQAIENHRAGSPTGLAEPNHDDYYWTISYPYIYVRKALFQSAMEAVQMAWKIYYMWETEDDPLLIKDYIRDMLLAWPLQDISIDLKDEGGSSLRVYPQWNNLET